MTGLPLLVFLLGACASYVRRGWLSIPLALLVPTIPTALGAFDDGESLGVIAVWFALWPTLAALGFMAGSVLQRRSTRRLETTQ